MISAPVHISDSGTLPKGWRWVKLGEVCEQIDYGFTASAVPEIKTPKFLRITDIQNGSVVWETVPGCQISASDEDVYCLADGDILFARTGATTGKSYLIADPPRSVFASYLIRLRLDPEQTLPAFLSMYFQSDNYWAQVAAGIRGGAQGGFNAAMLKKMDIPLPPLPEQNRIAAILTEQMAAVERARKAAGERLAAVNDLPTAYLRAVFPALDQPLPEGWRSVKLGEVCKINAAQVDPKTEAFRNLPHIFGESIEVGTGRLLEFRSAAEDGMISGKYLFSRGAVLYSKLRPYLKKAVLADFDGLCSADMYPLSANADLLLPAYLLQVLLSEPFTQFAVAESQRARMPKLNRDQLFSYVLPLPPLHMQQRIAAMLSEQMAATERTRKAAGEEMATINALPAALLHLAFSGRL